jgi:hypothetical protein
MTVTAAYTKNLTDPDPGVREDPITDAVVQGVLTAGVGLATSAIRVGATAAGRAAISELALSGVRSGVRAGISGAERAVAAFIDRASLRSLRSAASAFKTALARDARSVTRLTRDAAEGDEALLSQARTARDALAEEVGSRTATVTGGYNVETGEVAAACSGPGFCAENAVVSKLGGNAADVRFTEAIRPRTGLEVPICEFCQAQYAPSQFPPSVQYKPGFPWDHGFWVEP